MVLTCQSFAECIFPWCAEFFTLYAACNLRVCKYVQLMRLRNSGSCALHLTSVLHALINMSLIVKLAWGAGWKPAIDICIASLLLSLNKTLLSDIHCSWTFMQAQWWHSGEVLHHMHCGYRKLIASLLLALERSLQSPAAKKWDTVFRRRMLGSIWAKSV